LTLWAHDAADAIAATKVREDAALTHPEGPSGDAAAVLAVVLHSLLKGDDPSAAIESAHAFARRSGFSREAIEAVVESTTPHKAQRDPDVLNVLRTALFHLRTANSFEGAMESALALPSASDAMPAIVGAVMGARLGREGIPEQLRSLVLSCRPMEGLAPHPRPSAYWATDAMAMAEALLTAR
jgi:ADP-ribosyl-[dinitrogen reductase] hydrolase